MLVPETRVACFPAKALFISVSSIKFPFSITKPIILLTVVVSAALEPVETGILEVPVILPTGTLLIVLLIFYCYLRVIFAYVLSLQALFTQFSPFMF